MTGHDTSLATMPSAQRQLIAALATCLDPLSARPAGPARNGAVPGAPSPMRALFARLGGLLEDHGDYFAAIERSLPPDVRERRRARRDQDRLMLVAMLSR